jgi:tetraacyldisaccharide 4'-kinase
VAARASSRCGADRRTARAADPGLTLRRLPLPDHHRYDTLPWREGTAEVALTEKDAAKLVGRDTGATKVWVVALDSALPDTLVADIVARLPPKKIP